MNELKDPHIATIKNAAQQLTGVKRRALQAPVTLDDLNGSARRAEAVFGWSRRTVILGLHALRTGITCVDHTAARGNRPTEEKRPPLAEDRRSLVEPHRQVDPKFPSPCCDTRMTAKAMRQALIDQKNWQDGPWPCANTIGNILNRLGDRLRRVHKAKPIKRVRATEAIFDHVHREHHASDAREDSWRIAMDTKAKRHVGAFARGGESRGGEAIQAWDHDMRPKEKRVPCGILEVLGGLLTIMFGTSWDTSACLADGLQQGWNLHKDPYRHVRQRVIDLDNGPQNASCRTPCMQRMGECADRHALEVVWGSYPPYHSKDNPIERCWGLLE
jgi:Rhodopirellula transposase DDE domain